MESKKLRLKRTTLRTLGNQELDAVHGGRGASFFTASPDQRAGLEEGVAGASGLTTESPSARASHGETATPTTIFFGGGIIGIVRSSPSSVDSNAYGSKTFEEHAEARDRESPMSDLTPDDSDV